MNGPNIEPWGTPVSAVLFPTKTVPITHLTHNIKILWKINALNIKRNEGKISFLERCGACCACFLIVVHATLLFSISNRLGGV